MCVAWHTFCLWGRGCVTISFCRLQRLYFCDSQAAVMFKTKINILAYTATTDL